MLGMRSPSPSPVGLGSGRGTPWTSTRVLKSGLIWSLSWSFSRLSLSRISLTANPSQIVYAADSSIRTVTGSVGSTIASSTGRKTTQTWLPGGMKTLPAVSGPV